MVKAASVLAILFVLVCGLFFLMSYSPGMMGSIGSTPRPLPAGRALIELESSTGRSNASNEIRKALSGAVESVIPDEVERSMAAIFDASSSANYVIYNRLFCSTGATLKDDAQFDLLLRGWKEALIPTFADDHLRVLIEYRPLDGSKSIRHEFTVDP